MDKLQVSIPKKTFYKMKVSKNAENVDSYKL